jgi:hypothetical protein
MYFPVDKRPIPCYLHLMTLDAALFSARPEFVRRSAPSSIGSDPSTPHYSSLRFLSASALDSLPILSSVFRAFLHQSEAHPPCSQPSPRFLQKHRGVLPRAFSLDARQSRFAANFFRSNTYSQYPRFSRNQPKLAARKSCRCNTCKNSRRNSFRSNTYKNEGGGMWLVPGNAHSAPSRWLAGRISRLASGCSIAEATDPSRCTLVALDSVEQPMPDAMIAIASSNLGLIAGGAKDSIHAGAAGRNSLH